MWRDFEREEVEGAVLKLDLSISEIKSRTGGCEVEGLVFGEVGRAGRLSGSRGKRGSAVRNEFPSGSWDHLASASVPPEAEGVGRNSGSRTGAVVEIGGVMERSAFGHGSTDLVGDIEVEGLGRGSTKLVGDIEAEGLGRGSTG